MNSDSFFEIGSTHKVCEDYATSGVVDGRCYGIISDGCSSSADTDIGSRLLVKSLEQTIHNSHCVESCKEALVSSIYVAQAAAKIIGLPNHALDATLGFIIEGHNCMHVALQGDGVIVYKDRDGIWIRVIEYDQNAPCYLSYRLDNGRQERYSANCHGFRVWAGYFPVEDPGIRPDNPYPFSPMQTFCSNVYGAEWVAIFTDGLGSFKESFASAPFINPAEMVPYFTSFKNTNGEFVKRRCRKAMKEIASSFSNGEWCVEHNDDFAMACIHKKDD